MTKPLLLLELNELNFEFVRNYIRRGYLPAFRDIIERHGVKTTTSEHAYEHVEPWIQWVTAHTGKTFDQHRIFHLGDIVGKELDQIWEVLERRGIKVGALSPMNAENRLHEPAFFIPDPWTRTRVSADRIASGFHSAVVQAVNDNAEGRLTADSLLKLLAGFVCHVPVVRWAGYLRLAARSRRAPWMKAVVLDRLLADVFLSLLKRTRPGFASLFLNAAAHVQHHYMYNSAAYPGDRKNPGWYVSDRVDPLLDVYLVYDGIVSDLLRTNPGARIMLATGLHQDPYPVETYYWRLRNHDDFLKSAGMEFHSATALMSRDFTVRFSDEAHARAAEAILRGARIPGDDDQVFDVENRGDSVFCCFVYSRQIHPNTVIEINGRSIDLHAATTFVAIKNGHHNSQGYLVDTAATQASGQIPLTDIFHTVRRHFEPQELTT